MKAIAIAVLAVGLLAVLVAAKPQRLSHHGAVDQKRDPLKSGEDQRPEGPPSADDGDENSQGRPDKRRGQGQRPPQNHEQRPPHEHDDEDRPPHGQRPPHGPRPTPPPQEDSTTIEPEDSTTAEPEENSTL